jgi:hypothetical protein
MRTVKMMNLKGTIRKGKQRVSGKVLRIARVILLILAGGFYSCRKDTILYVPCPCEEKEEVADIEIPKNALFFSDSVPLSVENKYNAWVIYHTETDSTTLFIQINPSMTQIINICNFPDYAKKWTVPIQGYDIYLKGKLYRPCYEPPHYGDKIYYDYVLTNLKLK